jgi:tetratricopeptide (TPR) repeat protein/WD40 repeat protein
MLAVSAGDSRQVHLYDFDPAGPALRLARTFQAPGSGGTAVRFNPAGDRLVTRGWDYGVNLFDVHTGGLLFSHHGFRPTSATDLSFDPAGTRLAACRVGTFEERIGLWSVADAREYRALRYDARFHNRPGQRYLEWGLPAVHPDGRLAAQGLADGLALFDLESGQELAFIKIPQGAGGVTFDGAGRLLCNGFQGSYRWPVRPDRNRPGGLLVGPPERLAFPPGDRGIAASRDGKVIAQAIFGGGGWVMHPNLPQPRRLEAAGCHWADVSPDGRWVAFGVHAHPVHVYETASGKRVEQVPPDEKSYCRFSRDGCWLVTENDGGRAYRVGTWEPGPQLGAGVPWDVSPDGRLVVVGTRDGVYRLVELETGRELARLEDPEQLLQPALFTPDGTRLVVNALGGLRVWDLRRIRTELVKLDLDWVALPYPDRPATSTPAPPLQVRVDLGSLEDDIALGDQPTPDHLRMIVGVNSLVVALQPLNFRAYRQRGRAYGRLGEARKALDDYDKALWLMPEDDPSRADLLCRRAANHLTLEELDQALDNFRQAEALDPNHVATQRALNARTINDRVIALKGKNEFRGALDLLRQAVQIAPRDAFSHTHLAWVLLIGPPDLRQPADALRHAEEAVALDPHPPWYTSTLAVAHFHAGRVAEAVPVLEQNFAADQDGERGVDAFFLAMCHARLGDRAKAEDYFARAVKWLEARKNLAPADVVQLHMIRAEADAFLHKPSKP